MKWKWDGLKDQAEYNKHIGCKKKSRVKHDFSKPEYKEGSLSVDVINPGLGRENVCV